MILFVLIVLEVRLYKGSIMVEIRCIGGSKIRILALRNSFTLGTGGESLRYIGHGT